MSNDILVPERHTGRNNINEVCNAEDDFLMNEAIRSTACLTISEENGKICKTISQSEAAEAGDKNYEDLVSDLITHTTDKSNLQILMQKMDGEVKNVLKTKKSMKRVTTSYEKTVDDQPRDPRVRERIMTYLAKVSILGKCKEEKCNGAEPSMPLLDESEQFSESSLDQNKQLPETPLQENANPSETSVKEYTNSLDSYIEQNKDLSGTCLGQSEQLSGTPLEQNNSGAHLKSNEETPLLTSEQNEMSSKTSINRNLTMNSDEEINKISKSLEYVLDIKPEQSVNTTHLNNFTESKKCTIPNSANKLNTTYNSTIHNFNKLRRNIKGKYNQCFYRHPRNTMLYPWQHWRNRRPHYSNENIGRYFNINRQEVDNTRDVNHKVESMLDLLNNTSSSSLSLSPEVTLKNTRSRVSLRLENREKNLEKKLKSQANESIKPTLANKITEDLNNEALLNMLSKLNKFHTPITHQNQEDGQPISDDTQILQTFLPYQNPVENDQTMEILINFNEDRRKIIKLKSNEGFVELTQKLINSMQKEKIYKDFVNSCMPLNYQEYNSKFKEWVDIDDVDSFKLHDGVKLKVIVDKIPKKRKILGENHEKEKKIKYNEDQSKNLRKNDSDLSDRSKHRSTIKDLEHQRNKLFVKLRNDKLRNIQIKKDLSEEETDNSECELPVLKPPTNYFDKLRTFLEYLNEEKNTLEDSNSERANSERMIEDDEVSDKYKVNNITRKPSFKLIIPDEKKEAFIKNFEMKPRHPVQQLDFVTKKMQWGIPKYDLVHNERNADNSMTFVYSITINGNRVLGKEIATNKKDARKVAAQACLKKLGIAQIYND